MHRLVRAGVLLLGMVVAGCASTQVTSSWKDPAAQSSAFRKVLVVGLVPSESVRRNLEQQLATHLRETGVEAVPSAQFLGDGPSLTKEAVRKVVEENGFDSVLVTQYMGTQHKVEYMPGTYDDYFGFMGPMVYSPGYVLETTDVQLESRFFDASSGKMIWSARTSTVDSTDGQKEIPKVADKITRQLEKDVRI